ncbi:hypothetical protein Tco_1320031 [Tanacetum coccineum]
MYEKIKRSNEDFIAIGSVEDDRLINKMNKKDSSKGEEIKKESKEEVKEEVKGEKNKQKEKARQPIRTASMACNGKGLLKSDYGFLAIYQKPVAVHHSVLALVKRLACPTDPNISSCKSTITPSLTRNPHTCVIEELSYPRSKNATVKSSKSLMDGSLPKLQKQLSTIGLVGKKDVAELA